ncbi:hypothetical protein EJB05_08291 [Eragrostis curvula]|uniref:Uncharacterized protein n=1 Tax=Eragrostis curvula TaxID=38414 RepID=A0A5J9WMN7_9POAL|nr:hypothetical protein EJB05_08291 [Eragrostis curvula]
MERAGLGFRDSASSCHSTGVRRRGEAMRRFPCHLTGPFDSTRFFSIRRGQRGEQVSAHIRIYQGCSICDHSSGRWWEVPSATCFDLGSADAASGQRRRCSSGAKVHATPQVLPAMDDCGTALLLNHSSGVVRACPCKSMVETHADTSFKVDCTVKYLKSNCSKKEIRKFTCGGNNLRCKYTSFWPSDLQVTQQYKVVRRFSAALLSKGRITAI